MDKYMKVNLKNTIAHNIAQQILIGQDIYEYLGSLTDFLFTMHEEADYLTLDEIHEIYLYAYYKGKEEALYVVQMYEKYNIKVGVDGHGGSQIAPAVALEQYFK